MWQAYIEPLLNLNSEFILIMIQTVLEKLYRKIAVGKRIIKLTRDKLEFAQRPVAFQLQF